MIHTSEPQLIKALRLYREKWDKGDIVLERLEDIIRELQNKSKRKHRRKK